MKQQFTIGFGMTYGIAASGKSTLVQYICQHRRFPTMNLHFPIYTKFHVVSTDALRVTIYEKPLSEIFGAMQEELEKRVWKDAEDDIITHLKQHYTVILDATDLHRNYRLALLKRVWKLASQMHAPIWTFLLAVNISLDMVKYRNKQREAKVPETTLVEMEDIRQTPLEQPNPKEEKWDLIYFFDSEKYDLRGEVEKLSS
jgi:predicted kinase